ncbi:MAG TPA: outer membrane beta-barrel protein [Steroidobacteraceae bacterium]|jgi:hypothetical protein
MTTSTTGSRRYALGWLVVVTFCGVLTTAHAQGRAGDFDIFGSTGYTSGDSGNLKSLPRIRFDLDHAWMWGGGGAYHFTDQLSVLTDFQAGYPTLHLSDPGLPGAPGLGQTADYFNGRVNLELTPFATPVSPVLSAGIGFNNFQTAIPGADPQVVCAPAFALPTYWWCGAGVPTFNETAFSYNAGLGLRLDIGQSIFMKLMYTSTWADYGGLGTRRFDQVTLQLGGRVRTRGF